MGNRTPTGYFNQTYTIEFLVPGDLDGVTSSPSIEVPSRTDDPQNLYRPEVPGNLGIINTDYIVPDEPPYGASGNRYVAWFWLESPVAGEAGAELQVVDAVDGSPVVQEVLADLSGVSVFYRSTPFIVPQGSVLRILGFTNTTGTPIKIRLHIAYLNDQGMIAAQQAVCNCEGGGGGGDSPTLSEYGSIGWATTPPLDPPQIQVGSAAGWVDVQGPGVLDTPAQFSSPSANQLQYDGEGGVFFIDTHMTLVNNEGEGPSPLGLRITRNNVAIDSSVVVMNIGLNEIAEFSSQIQLELTTGDVIGVEVISFAAGADTSSTYFRLQIHGV